jgi:hypothetical protein
MNLNRSYERDKDSCSVLRTPADYVGESIAKEPEHTLKNDKTYGRLGLPAKLRFPAKKLFAAARSSQISPKFRV